MKALSKLLAIVVAWSVSVLAFIAYFIRLVDMDDGLVYDGFGRLLSEPPV